MAKLDYNGLSIDRQPEILDSIESAERELIHPDISTQDNEFLGHMNNILAEREALIQELIQAVYDSANILKAEGKNLDDLATLRKVTRASSGFSSTNRQQFTGKNGTIIPAGSVLTNPITEDKFTNPARIIIDTSSSVSILLDVKQIIDNQDYEIKINTTTYSYLSGVGDDKSDIVNGFNSVINSDVNREWDSSIEGSKLRVIARDYNVPMTITPISYIGADEVTVEAFISASEEGEVVAPPNTITILDAPPIGFISTSNVVSLNLGRSEESDEELRLRIQNNRGSESTGTIPSITSSILNNVDGVLSVSIIENETHLTDAEGRPPHSFEAVVVGGVNSDVAQELWRTKPASISTYGNTTVATTDSNGNLRDIHFTRPTVVNLAVNITYERYDEEAFPLLGEDLIQEAVVEYINSLDLGNDVIPSRVSGIIYSKVTGIDEIVVEVQAIGSPTDTPAVGNWQSNRLPISTTEFVNITESDVYIQEVV